MAPNELYRGGCHSPIVRGADQRFAVAVLQQCVAGTAGTQRDMMPSQVKLILSPSKEQNPQQAEQGHAQMQQCV